MGDLRRSAWLIVAAALVPLLLFFVLQSGFSAREEQKTVKATGQAITRNIIVAADGEAMRHYAALTALATSPALRTSELDQFKLRAEDLIALNPGWKGVALVDPSTSRTLVRSGDVGDRLIFSTSGPAGDAPRFLGFSSNAVCACLVFDRRARGPDGTLWAVRLFVDPVRLNALLPVSGGQYEVSALIDRQGRFIARSIANRQRFSGFGSVGLRKAVASGGAEGAYRNTTLEGMESYTSFARSPLTGWSAHVAQTIRHVDSPARRFFTSLGVAALLSILLATVLILFAVRQLRQGRQLAERMQQAQKLEALGQLTGGIAHDFNNLLTPVVGALDFVSKKPGLDASSRRLLAGALASAQRAGKLTAQLLAFSRRQKLTIEPIDVSAMIDDMGELFRQSIGNSHRLEIIQNDGNLCANSDLNQLELAILNLLINARDASPPGGVIRLAVTATGSAEVGETAIAVTDQGSGMDEATRQRAIEPFFTTKAVGRGTGLGLAQVFGTAAQSGGRLTIDSTPGAGTTVTIHLGRCAEAPARVLSARASEPEMTPSLRLLVVDDDPLVRLAIARPLEEAGHIVDTVSDAPTAIAAIKQRRFDLALVDFAMPGMDGAELIHRASAVRPDQRFLMITGYADSEAVEAIAEEIPLLRKPFAVDDLIAMVQRLAAGS